ncbi:putative ATP-dependent endonuclease of OLD family [Catenulispora sp. EB89]|uniref:ATP-dependent nuclease n=1 Tax=Catenulispora sp. EB89 TaxID=3156257 RepID=UPI003512AABE
MHLQSFSVHGFRSLDCVGGIPVGGPTILAGHNDGGKTALLTALAFLLGEYALSEDDRTYQNDVPGRCESTDVEGSFLLDDTEQAEFGLPADCRLRRRVGDDLKTVFEIWGPIADDERLRGLERYNAQMIKELVIDFGLPVSTRKADNEATLKAFADAHSSAQGWSRAPAGLDLRLPRLLPYDGLAADPDDAVRTALLSSYNTHLADPGLQGRLREIETEIEDRVAADAKGLCDHIRVRCPELHEVFVEPDVSFKGGFRGAPLRISRASGESVGIGHSGLGSSRRVSLAVWEWTSEFLRQERVTDGVDDRPPVQTIVVYDEPDTHLDYANQRKIMELIREQSGIPGVRVLVATHSMSLIDGVDIPDVVHLKLIERRTSVERLGVDEHGAVDEHLQGIAAAVGLTNSILLHERCFLAVEGDTELRAFPVLFRLCEGLSLQSAGIALWGCFNNEGALHLAGYLAKHDRSVLLAVDADSRRLPKSIFKETRLNTIFGGRQADVVKFIGEEDGVDEFEALFTDDQWTTAANDLWPRTDGQPWSPRHFEAHRGDKFSSGVQVMLQEGSESGPGGKPDMMYTLAKSLKSADEVPCQLRDVFSQARRLAG